MIKISIVGAKKLVKKLDRMAKELRGSPMRRGMRRAVKLVAGSARRNAPHDTGALRGSINEQVVTLRSDTVRGIIGSNLVYAPAVELGARPHWPPPGALSGWAARHGFTERAIRMSIASFGTSKMAARLYGGQQNQFLSQTFGSAKGFRFLQRALDQNARMVTRLLGDVVARIVLR